MIDDVVCVNFALIFSIRDKVFWYVPREAWDVSPDWNLEPPYRRNILDQFPAY